MPIAGLMLRSLARSQSALEYMMIYGWAILIIVIVAAVLYGFGIFSPKNMLTQTVTGFAGLGVQATCYSTGLAVVMQNELGYPVLLESMNLTFSNGTDLYVGLSNSGVVNAGGSYKFLVLGVCPSSGIGYSFLASLKYIEPGSALGGSYYSSGSITGTSAENSSVIQYTSISPSNPSNVKIELFIDNSQGNTTALAGTVSNFTAIISPNNDYVTIYSNISGSMNIIAGPAQDKVTYTNTLSPGTYKVTASSDIPGVKNVTYHLTQTNLVV